MVPARAGVHGSDDHRRSGEAHALARSRDHDLAFFHRGAECFDRIAAELRELVEKEDATVRECELARANRIAAPYDCRRAGSVMWCAKGPLAADENAR